MTLNAIIANFQTFKLVDLLDIIIIAFLIYQLLGIINRTRAGQLLAADPELAGEVQLAGAVLDFTRGNETFLTSS